MSNFIVTNISYGLTGRRGAASRFTGSLRVENGVISDIGDVRPNPGEEVLDATGCVVAPGFVNTHHHLFQSAMKSVPAAINSPLDEWVMEVPYRYWPALDAHTLRVSAVIGLVELALSGTTTVADQHYIFSSDLDYDPAEILFDAASEIGLRFVMGRGGLTVARPWHRSDIPPAPTTEMLRHSGWLVLEPPIFNVL